MKNIIKKIVSDITAMVKIFIKHRANRSGAECAYFLTLSFFPFLICFNFIVGRWSKDAHIIFEIFTNVLPTDGVIILEEYLTYLASVDSNIIVILGLTSLVGSGSGAFRSILSIFEDIYGMIAYKSFKRIIFTGVSAVLFPIAVFLTIVLILCGNLVLKVFSQIFIIDMMPILVWYILNYFLLFFAGMGMLYFLYRFSTPGKNKFKDIKRGIIIGSVALFLTSALFSKIIEIGTKYSLVYGSLASIIILMLWLYICTNIVVAGGIINFYYKKN